jgi:hypothetical protein
MPYIAKKCHAMLMPSGTSVDPTKKHLFIVCTDKCANGKHLLVTVTGWTNNLCDATTRLAAGEHPFITKDSYILYRKCRIETAEDLGKGVDGGIFIPRDAAGNELMAKILAGICTSEQTPRKVKRYAGCPEPQAPAPAA